MVDRDPEVLFDGLDELARPVGQRRVNLVVELSRPSIRHEGVARHGKQRHAVVVGIQSEDHDDVAVDAVHALLALLDVDVEVLRGFHGAARGRTDEEDVLDPLLDVLQAVDLDAADLVDAVDGDPDDGTEEEDDAQDEREHAAGGPAPEPAASCPLRPAALAPRPPRWFASSRGAAEAAPSPDADELEFGMSGTGVQGTGCDARRVGAPGRQPGGIRLTSDRRPHPSPQPRPARGPWSYPVPVALRQSSAKETAVPQGTPARQADPRPLGPLVASQRRIRPALAVRPRRCPGRPRRHPFGRHRVEPAGSG